MSTQAARYDKRVKRPKILTVDDQRPNLIALEAMFKSLDIDFVGARSGEEALKRILEDEFALILMDVNMPGMDGFETAETIRHLERARHIPIVFLTASEGDEASVFKGYSLGAVDFLRKPVVPEILLAKVKALVEREKNVAWTLTLKADELARTIAERESAEKSRSQAMAILDATPDLVATIDLGGFTQYLNPAGRRMLGIPEHEDVSSLKIADMRPAWAQHVIHGEASARILKDGMWSGESAFRSRDGRDIPVSQVILTHRRKDGSIEYFSTIARDISEQKRSEEQLRQSQKLEAIGRLAGGVAHDFNNLLTVILGRSQLLQAKVQNDSTAARDADLIFKTGERAAALTRQLLAFSRKQVLQPKILDLNTIVSETEKMLRRLIGEDIELKTILEPDLGHVKADPGQIEQVIMNLAVNARDAMPGGGKLIIETGNTELDACYASQRVSITPGPYVMLAVSDTGCGMSPEIQSRIFEPFFTTKEPGKGTGLGLATVYGIVTQSGGNIWVYSEIGRGTTFKVYLPRVNDVVDAVESKTLVNAVGGSETILLVEDDDIVREHTEDILRSAGYTVLLARDGDHALRVSAQHTEPINLMLSDVVMPKMKGPQLARRLSASRPDIKILLVSGYTDTGVVDQDQVEPGTNFLQKPFAADTLLARVRAILDS